MWPRLPFGRLPSGRTYMRFALMPTEKRRLTVFRRAVPIESRNDLGDTCRKIAKYSTISNGRHKKRDVNSPVEIAYGMLEAVGFFVAKQGEKFVAGLLLAEGSEHG